MSLLVLNAGSSTLKFGLFAAADLAERAAGRVDWKGGAGGAECLLRAGAEERRARRKVDGYAQAAETALELLAAAGFPRASVRAAGHRVVHGGARFRASVRVTSEVEAALEALAALAPLHNPPALEALRALRAALPAVPHVAAFDTAFFAALPESACVYPLPWAWHRDWGVRRFGFHGLSHACCARAAGERLAAAGRPAEGQRVIPCPLGNGCSAAAVRGGTPLATTMGFTPLDGLMMGTRSGAVDPGILLYALRERGLDAAALEDVLQHHSGLLGVSGVSGDFREVEAAAAAGHARARLALEIYARRVREAVGALAVTLGGVDGLVFTAGVGEHSAALRAAACAGLECLGLRLDAERNRCAAPGSDIAAVDSAGRIFVFHTREEAEIARETRCVLAGAGV